MLGLHIRTRCLHNLVLGTARVQLFVSERTYVVKPSSSRCASLCIVDAHVTSELLYSSTRHPWLQIFDCSVQLLLTMLTTGCVVFGLRYAADPTFHFIVKAMAESAGSGQVRQRGNGSRLEEPSCIQIARGDWLCLVFQEVNS